MDTAFPIKGRYIVALWILPFVYLPGMGIINSLLGENSAWYWYDVLFYFYFQGLFTALLAFMITYYKINWPSMVKKANSTAYLPSIKLTGFIFILSIATAYALFYPLSLIYPDFVNFWFIDIPPMIYSDNNGSPILPNMLNFLSIVLIAPIIEEITFRGLLLHRWTEKWGIYKAILFSSLLFGIAHPEPIGATAFGVAMCILYLKTQTLIIPMVCHALNNLAAWLIEAGYRIGLGPEYVYTLKDFQADWVLGLICALITSAWASIYLKGKPGLNIGSLPPIAAHRYTHGDIENRY